jgi:hypothetical protein
MYYTEHEQAALEKVLGSAGENTRYAMVWSRELPDRAIGSGRTEVTILTRKRWKVTYHRVLVDGEHVRFHYAKPFRPIFMLTTHGVGKVAMVAFFVVAALSFLGLFGFATPLAAPSLLAGTALALHVVMVEQYRYNVRDANFRTKAILHDLFVLLAFAGAIWLAVTGFMQSGSVLMVEIVAWISLAWAILHASWLSSLTDRFLV